MLDLLRPASATQPRLLERLRSARWLWVSLLAFGLTRLGIVMVMYLADPLINNSSTPLAYHLRPGNTLLDALGSRWDTRFYLDIADHGYVYRGAVAPSVAFFPLLPLLIVAGTAVLGDAVIAGLVITNLALLGATMLLHLLTADEWGPAVADRAVWYLLIFPASFFGSAIYTEALFLCAAIGSLYAARKGYWGVAALLGIAASLTRVVGVIVAPLLLFERLRQIKQHDPDHQPSRWTILAPLAVPLGTLGYMGFLQLRFGNPLAFVHAATAWDRAPRSPLATLGELFVRPLEGWGSAVLSGHLPLDKWLDAFFSLSFLVLGGVLLRQRRWGEGIFVLLGTLIPLSTALLASQRRYVWVLFPVFVLLARWGAHPWVDRLITICSLLGLGLMSALFANWYWVA